MQLSPSQQAASMAPLQALEMSPAATQSHLSIGQSASTIPREQGLPLHIQSASPGSTQMPMPQSQRSTTPQSQQTPEARLPSSLADLVTSFESAKQKCWSTCRKFPLWHGKTNQFLFQHCEGITI